MLPDLSALGFLLYVCEGVCESLSTHRDTNKETGSNKTQVMHYLLPGG